jgi:hypothetical protein
VTFGGQQARTFQIINDSTVLAVVDSGASGDSLFMQLLGLQLKVALNMFLLPSLLV